MSEEQPSAAYLDRTPRTFSTFPPKSCQWPSRYDSGWWSCPCCTRPLHELCLSETCILRHFHISELTKHNEYHRENN